MTRVGGLQEVAHEHEVAERLRHLLALVAHHRRVHPVAGERLAGERFALRDLALVVREDEVGTAAVEVDGRAVLVQDHRRALDVPARPTGAERRLPRPVRRRPKAATARSRAVATVRVVGVAAPLGRARASLRAIVRELPEVRALRDVEVHGTHRCVRAPGFEEPADEFDDTRHRLGGTRFGDRRPHVERGHVALEARGLGRGQLEERDPELAGLGRMESSTSVMLRTIRTSWPRSSSRRIRRS